MILSDVCLSRTSGLSREQRGIGTEIAHVARDSDTTFKVKRSKVKGQGHQAALLSATLTRKAAAAVSVGTYSAWESTTALRLLRGARVLGRPRGEERGGGILCRHAHSIFVVSSRPPVVTLRGSYSLGGQELMHIAD